MKKKPLQSGRPALDLVEDAVHLLRTSPAAVVLAYYTGAIPFVLGLLHFWADMSCGAFAGRRCPAAALGLTLLFIWLKCWQSVFSDALRARLAGTGKTRWNFSRVLRLVLVQGILQPPRLLLLPAALIIAIPFGWVLAFFENATVLGTGAEPGVRPVFRRALAQAQLWPKQNHLLLLLLALLAVVLWLNALIAVLTVPHLLKMFLGVETAFSRAGVWVVLNTTFIAVTIALAWLVLDPLVKAVYTLRCFHGEARTNGADLLAELSFVRAGGKTLAVASLFLLTLAPLSSRAANPVQPQGPKIETPAAVPPAQLEDAVKQTLQQDKYAWRLPRVKTAVEPDAGKSWIESFFTSIGNTLMDWVRAVRDWFRSVLDWFDRNFTPKAKPADSGGSHGFDWAGKLRWLAYLLLLLAGAALVLLGVRLWRQGGRRSRGVVAAEVVAARPDLNDENLTAAQLPEDEWLKLAREMLERGDLRLALRAFYLATLAHLAAREIVSIARFKSNRDYETEVNRRARGLVELCAAFSANVSSFDRAWYGLHDVTAGALDQFQANFERIRLC